MFEIGLSHYLTVAAILFVSINIPSVPGSTATAVSGTARIASTSGVVICIPTCLSPREIVLYRTLFSNSQKITRSVRSWSCAVEIAVARKCYSEDTFCDLLRRIVGLRNEKDRKNEPLWCFRTTAGMQEVERSRMPEPSRNIFCRTGSLRTVQLLSGW